MTANHGYSDFIDRMGLRCDLSSLTGTIDQVKVEQEVPRVDGRQEEIDKLLAGVDMLVAEEVRYLFAIMDAHPIRPWLSENGMEAGVHCTGVVGWDGSEVLSNFRAVFFGRNHGVICELLEDRLLDQGRLYASRAEKARLRFDEQGKFPGWDQTIKDKKHGQG